MGEAMERKRNDGKDKGNVQCIVVITTLIKLSPYRSAFHPNKINSNKTIGLLINGFKCYLLIIIFIVSDFFMGETLLIYCAEVERYASHAENTEITQTTVLESRIR